MSKNYANLLSLCVAKIAFSLISFFLVHNAAVGVYKSLRKICIQSWPFAIKRLQNKPFKFEVTLREQPILKMLTAS